MNTQDKALLDQVTLDEPWALIEEFAGFAREHPDDVNRGMDLVTDRLKAHGVPVEVHKPSLYLSIPGKARVETGGRTFRAKPPAYSVHAGDGLSGQLAYMPANQADDIDTIFDKKLADPEAAEKSIRGNIVISEGFASPGMISEFQKLGAIGVIGINPGVDIHWGICTEIWGIPGLDDLDRKPTVPAVAVNKPDGDALIAIAKVGGSVTLYTDMEEGWFDSKLPVVDIPGNDGSGEYVLLHGHLDSWDVGVGDNAVGDATMLEVARVLWANRSALKRGVRICWWPGHSTGRYAGSTWFADHFALDLEENCVAQVNCDSPGCRWATEFTQLSVMSEADAFLADIVSEVANKTTAGERPHRAGDYSFNNIGISSYLMLSSTMTEADREEKGYYAVGGCGGNIAWHTENDTLEIADKDSLIRDIKIYLLAVFRNANATILPFDWRATTAEFLDTIANYQKKAGDRFDLAPSRDAANSLQAALDGFYGDIAADSISAARANSIIKELARILVPINFTEHPRFTHDPALTVKALPTIALASELDSVAADKLGFAQTQLVRGQNRLISALNQARRMVDSAKS